MLKFEIPPDTFKTLLLGLEESFVLAVISVESAGNRYAWNPEPSYRYLWNVKQNEPWLALNPTSTNPDINFPTLAGDKDQEWWGQRASWGLMQIMGAVARECGFRGPYLTELTSPDVNIQYGCIHMKRLLTKAHGDYEQAAAMWNGGPLGNLQRPFRNAAYATKVMTTMHQLLQKGKYEFLD